MTAAISSAVLRPTPHGRACHGRRPTLPLPAVSKAPSCDTFYCVDINVFSAGALIKSVPAVERVDWTHLNGASHLLPVVAIVEFEDRIARNRRADALRNVKPSSDWLEVVLHLYAAKDLPVDIAVALHIQCLCDLTRI